MVCRLLVLNIGLPFPRSRSFVPLALLFEGLAPNAIHLRLFHEVFEFSSSIKMFSHLRLIAALAVVCSHIQFTEALLNNCLGPSGVQDFGLFACSPEASESACCPPGNICYSNGLCAPGPTQVTGITPFFLDGCTDKSFTAPACIPNCLTSEFHLSLRR
jgi:hypothetical protein